MSTLKEIEARIAAATPGPWEVGKRVGAPASTLSILGPEKEYDYGGDSAHMDRPVVADVWVGNAGTSGAELVAHAPADLAALVQAVKAMADTHAEHRRGLTNDGLRPERIDSCHCLGCEMYRAATRHLED